ncbi:M20/M25/M40 family metallo-hydrolase [Zunongwangia sp. SCSIO 43204]|uniref:M20/M25/M40 family metallo-hydrolase n=1 Tax=Zunongwangia sp. SCSIO 43204 TaxID=2779359 RepID=UPI001CAA2C36|nr:M20/M25/M40 family metallo-hydrolase [Zunongwangia sp. SCSIO 43204]UAB85446.1 M20/M25/M40 family metallo-hydrolase [Zunongwangia sp. SCSIO 43204]
MSKNLQALIALLLISFSCWLSFYSLKPSDIQEEVPENEFSVNRAFQHVEKVGESPHYLGSAAHSSVRNYIVNELQNLGLEVQTQEDFVLNDAAILSRPQNILTRIEGNGNGDALVLMSHYDSQPHSSHGASDAGSGVATILEGLRAFIAEGNTPDDDIIILFTDAEEIGLMGAELFIKEHPWAKDAKLALNFEARGSGGSSFMLLETNAGNGKLIKAFKAANVPFPTTNSLAYSVYKLLPNDTDLTVLREFGNINGFNFAFIGDHFDYHTANDVPKNLDLQTLAHQGDYLMPLLHYFKNADLNQLNSDQDLLYFNLPFGQFITYPFSWITPMLILAFLLFFIVVGFGISKKQLDIKTIFKGFVPYFLSLTIGGLLVFGLWKFCLYIYPEYSEMLHGFTYNGYSYITAAILLSLTVAFFVYHKFYSEEHTASQFVAPLFFWILICSLLAFGLKGAAYFIIPAYFGIIQLFLMLRQKQPNLILNTVFSLPALFILFPFIQMFPVALGLKILFVAAILSILLFTLFLPVFGYFSKKDLLAVLLFIGFNVFMFYAHFTSEFTSEKPKPNSLVYLFDADEDKANWFSYDSMIDEWTAQYFGEEPVKLNNIEAKFSSKYNSGFTWRSDAPTVNIDAPGIILQKIDSTTNEFQYSLKIAPNRDAKRMEIYTENLTDFSKFEVNGRTPEDVKLGEESFNMFTRRWRNRLLSYYISSKDTLRMNFSLDKSKSAEFILYESSYDLLENEELNVPKRAENMMPKPFVLNDAVIYKKKIKLNQ